MTFYDFTSTFLTVVGYTVLVYRIIFELQSGKLKKSKQEKLCTKWLIFTIFLKIQYTLLAIIEIIPFGTLLLLVFKLFLFLPENAISHEIYKRIQKQMQKIKLEEYNSHFGIAISFVCTYTVALLMKLTGKIAAYIDSKHIEQVEKHILQILKTLEYKKSAINMRHQAVASQINQQLDSSEFNVSTYQEPIQQSKSIPKTNIGNQVSRILVDFDQDVSEQIKLKAEQMIIKPNKATGQKAKYQDVQIEYYHKTCKITFTNKLKASQSKTLKQIKWITKNMMNIQVVFKEGGSKILKIKDANDVVRWVEPVCLSLRKGKEHNA